jgi:hypothetical protein
MPATLNLVESPPTREVRMPDCDPGPKGPNDLLTQAGIAKEYGISRESVRLWAKRGLHLHTCIRSGGRAIPVYLRSDVEAYYNDPQRTLHRRRSNPE